MAAAHGAHCDFLHGLSIHSLHRAIYVSRRVGSSHKLLDHSTNQFRYVYIFAEVYGINEGLANICFLGLFVGILISMVFVPILYHRTAKQLRDAGDDGSGRMLDRESRLFFARIGAPAIPIGLFWMGWTDYVCPIPREKKISTNLLGFHFYLVSLGGLGSRRVRSHLHLPLRLYVHHRLLPAVRSVCTYLCRAGPIPGCGRNDCGGGADVSQSRYPLDTHCAWDNQRCGCPHSLCAYLLGTFSPQEKQMGYSYVFLRFMTSGSVST